jgi:hypothetical protein
MIVGEGVPNVGAPRAAARLKGASGAAVFTIETMGRSLPAVSIFVKLHKGFQSHDALRT